MHTSPILHILHTLYILRILHISQILAQIPPKTFQNPAPSDPKSIQKGSWRESGSYLGPMLEKSPAKRRPRAPKRRPRVPKRCPRGAPERPRGAQEPPKPLPNGALGDYFSCVFRFVALLLLEIAFWSDLFCVFFIDFYRFRIGLGKVSGLFFVCFLCLYWK